ncbi:MAG TPA: metallophosphoesterase [Gemmataceae bacterium]|nr:metallophosphoesterase [Gemmataceae bacterium]
MTSTLVRPLFDGPIDIVGDVHGEIDALVALLQRLGYDAEGRHPEGRRLVFVGDLVDRGPDSPAVLERVRRLMDSKRAQCVLGNHELNILLGRRKPDNIWFFHHELPAGHPAAARPQVWIDEGARDGILGFFAELPLALERPDVRVVHACWDDDKIALARQAASADKLHHEHRARIEESIRHRGLPDSLAQLARQNDNPVKLLTSGPEMLADQPFEAMGQLRYERRIAWWRDYTGPLCLFGHYWRILLPHEIDGDRLFTDIPRNAMLGKGDAMCIDYSVGKRFLERAAPGFQDVFQTRLAALRLPERRLIFDEGDPLQLAVPWRSRLHFFS